jgi:hypothetical protein
MTSSPRTEDGPRGAEFEEAYPRALWQRERVFVQARRGGGPVGDLRPPDDAVGVALSGGGIRSATFALGIFQGLSRQRLLSRIDYLSTVSGGGYFGAFLGRLFTREEVRSASDVEGLLHHEGHGQGTHAAHEPPPPPRTALRLPDVVRWLRENGRYLSPNGAGDLLVGGAVAFRNWFAIQVVLLSFVFTGVLLLQLARTAAKPLAARVVGHPGPSAEWTQKLHEVATWVAPRAGASPDAAPVLWWSPFLLVALIPLLFVVIPTGWAYWVVGGLKGGRPWYENPLLGLVLSGLVAVGVLVGGVRGMTRWHAGWGLLGEALLTAVWWGVASAIAWYVSRAWRRQGGAVAERLDEGFWASEQRNFLSRWLKNGLIATGAVLAFALIDSLGQTLYVVATLPGAQLWPILGGLFAALTGAAGLAPRLAIFSGARPHGRRLRIPASLLATAVAIAVVGLVLLALDMLSHAVAWRGCLPWMASRIPPTTWWWADPSAQVCWRPARDGAALALVGAVGVLACLVFGRSWPFLNNSSLHALYSARLTRAYLGASNPRRVHEDAQSVTRVVPEDNVAPAAYWQKPPGMPPAPCQKGAPLHLINATINETVDGRSQVQQQDRKGVGLAVGPCAFSVGIRHHAIFPSHAELGAVTVAPADAATYRVFAALDRATWLGGEPLTIGQWVGISGAAFSTGLGARTNLGLSLLCGLSNVRLGYWWNSNVSTPTDTNRARRSWLEDIFPLQAYLLRELLSRFSGTARPRWYLSDGGHFDNSGGYELVRRRLLRMVVVDAEADPLYTFEGLANLVRKARLDFGAEIRFLSARELDDVLPPTHRHLFGSLDELRPRTGVAALVAASEPRAPRPALDPGRGGRLARAHAALASVQWADEPGRRAWLLYLKPTLSGDEPADVRQYHEAHPSFPQETTGDQFFDEAQWESYRMLGFTIADAVFAPGEPGHAPAPRDFIFLPSA